MRIDLKNFRQSHNLYQSDMAELLDINQSNVSRAELRGFIELTYGQRKKLIEKFGKENLKEFIVPDDAPANVPIIATGNRNVGNGTQNNGYIGTGDTAMAIIRQQSEAMTELAQRQAVISDKLITLLDKISERL